MAAPKQWGYTRDQETPDELLVAWADGDIIKILDKEIVERLLSHRDQREVVAAYARACQDTARPSSASERVERPRSGLVQLCKELGHDHDLNPAPHVQVAAAGRRSLELPIPPLSTVLGAGVALAITGLLLFWMFRTF